MNGFKVKISLQSMLSAARIMRISAQGLTLGATFWLSSCRTPPPTPPPPPPAAPAASKPTVLYEWNGEKKGISRIVINVDEQKAYLYNGKDQVGWTYVATGIPSFPTPTGNFKVLEKVKDKVSNLYGKSYTAEGKLANSDFKIGRDIVPPDGRFDAAKMPYFMRLTGDGVGMHIGPIPRPGRRASHGCIRMPAKMAPIVYNNISIGTPVEIIGSGPDYATYLKQSAEKAKENAAKLAAAKKKAEEKAAADAAAGITTPGQAPTTADATATITIPPSGAASPTSSPATESVPVPGASAPLPTPKPEFRAPTEEIKPALPGTSSGS